jgi:hypothetical protein
MGNPYTEEDDVQVTRAELFELAHSLGHTDPAVFETRGGRFFCTCSCGYESTTRTSFVLALQAGVHHALKSAKEHLANNHLNGRVSRPENVRASR